MKKNYLIESHLLYNNGTIFGGVEYNGTDVLLGLNSLLSLSRKTKGQRHFIEDERSLEGILNINVPTYSNTCFTHNNSK